MGGYGTSAEWSGPHVKTIVVHDGVENPNEHTLLWLTYQQAEDLFFALGRLIDPAVRENRENYEEKAP